MTWRPDSVVLDVDAMLSAETQDYKYIEIGYGPDVMAFINGPRTDTPTAAPTIVAPKAAPKTDPPTSASTPQAPRVTPKKGAPTSASTPQAPKVTPQKIAPTSALTPQAPRVTRSENCTDIGYDNTRSNDSADDRCIDSFSDNASSTGNDLFYNTKYTPKAPPGPGYWKVVGQGRCREDYEWVAGGSLFRTDTPGKVFKKTVNRCSPF
jgi:hypothetical protein